MPVWNPHVIQGTAETQLIPKLRIVIYVWKGGCEEAVRDIAKWIPAIVSADGKSVEYRDENGDDRQCKFVEVEGSKIYPLHFMYDFNNPLNSRPEELNGLVGMIACTMDWRNKELGL